MKAVFHCLAATLIVATSSPVLANKLTTYDARYEVERGGSNYGEAFRKLRQQDDGSYVLENETEISFLFLSDVRRYDSSFRFVDEQVTPQQFRFKRSGTGRNKGISVSFDYQRKQVVERDSGTPLPITWHEAMMDEASMLEQLRFDLQHSDVQEFSYQIVDDKGENDQQTFRRGEAEVLNLPYGDITALKVERVRKSSSRETDYWFAPELDYVLVKMQQRKEGDEVATLLLETLD